MKGSDCSVLIIGSSRGQIETYEHWLAQSPGRAYRIATASFESSWSEQLRPQSIDAVILAADDGPNQDLGPLLRQVAAAVRHSIPAIVIGHNDAEVAAQVMRAGAVDYRVRQRLNPEQLCQALDQALSLGAARTTPAAPFYLAVNAVSYIVCVTSAAGQIEFLNARWQEYTGASRPATVADLIDRFLHPEDRAPTLAAFAQAQAARTTFRVEHRIRAASGTYRWFLSEGKFHRGAQSGQDERSYWTAVDIHERKRAEAERLKSEAHFRGFAENSNDVIWLVDPQFEQLLYVSPSYERVWQRSAEELYADLGQFAKYLDPEDCDRIQATRRGSHQQSITQEYRIIRPDGTTAWIRDRSFPIYDVRGELLCMGGIAEDISDRKRTEMALSASEAKYRTLFDSIDEAFCLLEIIYNKAGDPIDWHYRDINPAFAQHAGAIGSSTGQIPDLISFGTETYLQVARTGEPVQFEHHLEDIDRWFSVCASRVGDRSSRLVAVVLNDITERKRREATAAFFAEVAEDFSRLSRAEDITQAVGAKLGRHLQVTTCNFIDVCEDQDEVVIHNGWSHPEVLNLEGVFRISQYLDEEFKRASRSGVPFVVTNTQSDPRTDAAGFAALDLQAMVTVPFHHDGRWTHLVAVGNSSPRSWHDHEIELIEEISNRIFPRLDRARAEAALRAEEQRYRSIFETVSVSIWEEDFSAVKAAITQLKQAGVRDFRQYFAEHPEFVQQAISMVRIHDVNQASLSLFQAETKADLLTSLNTIFTPDTRQSFVGELLTIAEEGSNYTSESTVKTLRGETIDIWFSITFPPPSSSYERVLVSLIDITDRKQAETRIAADLEDTRRLRDLSAQLYTEENSQVLYDQILATAIALMGSDAGAVQILDDATQTLLLLAVQGFDSTMIDSFYQVDASAETFCGAALNTRQRMCVDFDGASCEDPDGFIAMHLNAGYRTVQFTPLMARSGRPLGMVSTHWRSRHRPTKRELRFLDLLARQAADLIEQRQSEAERRRLLESERTARAVAENASRIKDEFLAILSHELRSPLNPILGWSKILQTQTLDAARTQRALATIERNAKLQTQLINDLLDMARILRGKLKLDETIVNLAAVIEAAVEVVRMAAEAKQISLHVELIDSCQIRGDEGRLQQVVWNLLSNAIKFTAPGGHVGVCLEQVSQQAQITVTDTGMGINPKFLPHLFESFRQQDVSITRQHGGLGLGLSIVKYLLDAHGGNIQAISPGEGQGASFIVSLPLFPGSELAGSRALPSPGMVDLTGIRVLAVDDSQDSRELLAMLLVQYGAEAEVLTSGAEVLERLQSFKPHVLACDIGMPEIDGYRLIQQIRALPQEQGGAVPAIAVTAFAGEEDQQQALKSGFQKHLAKPIEPEALATAILEMTKT